ncbi:MAG: hypothetical protein R2788_12040 [Saprospiraceae bacterium]
MPSAKRTSFSWIALLQTNGLYANGFADATADLFSSVTLGQGTTGYMGYGRAQTNLRQFGCRQG